MDVRESCIMISSLTQTVTVKFAKIMSDSYSIQGVTPSQAAIMLLLGRGGAQKISEIAAKLGMAESNVSNICSRLERAGYVVRRRQSDDRRAVKIEPTEAAAQKTSTIKNELDIFIDKMQKLLTVSDLDDIAAGLRKLDRLFDLFLANR